jgi:hypothetical protein
MMMTDSGRSEDVCMRCNGPNPCWFAPHEVWNYVVGGPSAKGDPGGFLCPTCFIQLAAAVGMRGAWELRPKRASPGFGGSACRRAILTALEASSPLTVRDLRPLVDDELGRPSHPKTTGATLQRLAQDGLVRNEGRKWFTTQKGSDNA